MCSRKSSPEPHSKAIKSHTTQLIELVHSDVNDPLEVQSLGGSRYFVTFIDDFSRWTSIFTMKNKSDTFKCFKIIRAQAEKRTGTKLKPLNLIKRSTKSAEELKILRTDNGGEYVSNKFKSYLQENIIQHQLTVAFAPQQNGVAERRNKSIMDCVRSMLCTSSLDKKFWAEALATEVYIRNRVVSRFIPQNITPHYQWIGEASDVFHLRVFGCKCWFVTPKSQRKKLDSRTKEGLMMGYSSQSKGYKIWDIESSKLVVSRDVIFNEYSVDPLQVHVPTNAVTDSNVASPGVERDNNVNNNIELSSYMSEDSKESE